MMIRCSEAAELDLFWREFATVIPLLGRAESDACLSSPHRHDDSKSVQSLLSTDYGFPITFHPRMGLEFR